MLQKWIDQVLDSCETAILQLPSRSFPNARYKVQITLSKAGKVSRSMCTLQVTARSSSYPALSGKFICLQAVTSSLTSMVPELSLSNYQNVYCYLSVIQFQYEVGLQGYKFCGGQYPDGHGVGIQVYIKINMCGKVQL
ncbi:Hypothetical_protein [Hexamita inflata]|uniref:Hypothetical_protein n=1 Tax=Hexamita inflata TaxID=28002 RepID=A0AA86UL06_9EUKA|nr:Hypothetical protein HINF_LOCUS43216 [Hexamita inflata]